MPQILSYTDGRKIVPKVQLNTLFTLRAELISIQLRDTTRKHCNERQTRDNRKNLDHARIVGVDDAVFNRQENRFAARVR